MFAPARKKSTNKAPSSGGDARTASATTPRHSHRSSSLTEFLSEIEGLHNQQQQVDGEVGVVYLADGFRNRTNISDSRAKTAETIVLPRSRSAVITSPKRTVSFTKTISKRLDSAHGQRTSTATTRLREADAYHSLSAPSSPTRRHICADDKDLGSYIFPTAHHDSVFESSEQFFASGPSSALSPNTSRRISLAATALANPPQLSIPSKSQIIIQQRATIQILQQHAEEQERQASAVGAAYDNLRHLYAVATLEWPLQALLDSEASERLHLEGLVAQTLAGVRQFTSSSMRHLDEAIHRMASAAAIDQSHAVAQAVEDTERECQQLMATALAGHKEAARDQLAQATLAHHEALRASDYEIVHLQSNIVRLAGMVNTFEDQIAEKRVAEREKFEARREGGGTQTPSNVGLITSAMAAQSKGSSAHAHDAATRSRTALECLAEVDDSHNKKEFGSERTVTAEEEELLCCGQRLLEVEGRSVATETVGSVPALLNAQERQTLITEATTARRRGMRTTALDTDDLIPEVVKASQGTNTELLRQPLSTSNAGIMASPTQRNSGVQATAQCSATGSQTSRSMDDASHPMAPTQHTAPPSPTDKEFDSEFVPGWMPVLVPTANASCQTPLTFDSAVLETMERRLHEALQMMALKESELHTARKDAQTSAEELTLLRAERGELKGRLHQHDAETAAQRKLTQQALLQATSHRVAADTLVAKNVALQTAFLQCRCQLAEVEEALGGSFKGSANETTHTSSGPHGSVQRLLTEQLEAERIANRQALQQVASAKCEEVLLKELIDATFGNSSLEANTGDLSVTATSKPNDNQRVVHDLLALLGSSFNSIDAAMLVLQSRLMHSELRMAASELRTCLDQVIAFRVGLIKGEYTVPHIATASADQHQQLLPVSVVSQKMSEVGRQLHGALVGRIHRLLDRDPPLSAFQDMCSQPIPSAKQSPFRSTGSVATVGHTAKNRHIATPERRHVSLSPPRRSEKEPRSNHHNPNWDSSPPRPSPALLSKPIQRRTYEADLMSPQRDSPSGRARNASPVSPSMARRHSGVAVVSQRPSNIPSAASSRDPSVVPASRRSSVISNYSGGFAAQTDSFSRNLRV